MAAVAGETTMKIPALGIILGILAALFIGNVKAQEHHHPPQDQATHEKFYSTWMMPDAPHVSCCAGVGFMAYRRSKSPMLTA
jgi:hypothetical protein